ncbi:FAD-dependent monooxygenase [Aureimonas jatrophae]|uniref:Salicylate hydroxylase n=1 Tax=Aureimonas jatrophae TaxID=1166073 RepID=A0A1H0JMG8_9HYPH|nr:FAD-dependent monooxygenase [Aureimonas jatrophae]MBB3951338.1 salicylate hydroxylase [Aureimonas jatrophae]SDO44703.1 salicylate hydroxylase [Aureimonas jatrophae]
MRIAIAGAGIGGLTAALALARAGREVTVFERATALTPVGAGLQLSPNALDVLDRLGVARDLEGRAVPAETVTLRRGSSGRAIARIPVGSQDGRGYLSLLRADLQDALLAGAQAEPRIELRFGHEILAARREPAWVLQFSQDHPAAHCDVLVAADGVHSSIGMLLGGAPARSEGVAAVRLRVRQPASPGIEAWLGARAHAVAYPVAAGRETNLVLIGPDAEVAEAPASFFDGWDKRLLGLIEAGDTLGVWPLLTRTPRWRAPGLAYLGDAAHAMLPYAAQGAAMAIEDGWVLASCLARSPDVERALHDYEAARATRVARVLSRVAFHRRVYHLPAPTSFARDLVLMATPAKRLNRQLAWLYDWRAPPIDFATD